VAAAPPPPTDREPPLPSSFPKPLACPEPPATPDAAIELRCAAEPGLRPSRVALFFRAPGTEAFTEVPMTRSRKGWYVGEIPASATGGTLVQYYVEAQAPGNKVAATAGDAVSPNLLLLRTAVAEGGSDADEPLASLEEENPLEGIERERDRASLHRRPAGSWWVGLGLGSGYGWHPDRRLEFVTEKEVSSGYSRAGLLHLGPEVGYQLSEKVSFSLQGRHQFIPEEGFGDTRSGSPARSAHAVLARGTYFVGDGNLQAFGTATVGGGEGFRLVVSPQPAEGVYRHDTIRGGPIILGPGAGLVYHFGGGRLAWALELRALAGLPEFAAVAELSTGAAFAF
jgi:hypothetical protein